MSNKRRRHPSHRTRPRRPPRLASRLPPTDAHSIRTRDGYTIVAVDTGPCSAQCTCPVGDQPWSYTVGRSARGAAELVITGGYDLGLIADLTIEIAHHIDAHNLLDELDTGGVWDLGGSRLRLDVVPPEWLLNDPDRMARWVARYARPGKPLTPPAILQIVWPDDRGRLPDDPLCNPLVPAVQGLLARDQVGYPRRVRRWDIAG
jgi:hypothetical protein